MVRAEPAWRRRARIALATLAAIAIASLTAPAHASGRNAVPRPRTDARLHFEAGAFEPGVDPLPTLPGLEARETQGVGVQLVQFAGPVRAEWLDALRNLGIEPLEYVANRGYLLRTDAGQRARLAELGTASGMFRLSAPLPPLLKLGPRLRARFAPDGSVPDAGERVRIVLQRLIAEGGTPASRRLLSAPSVRDRMRELEHVEVEVAAGDLAEIARLADVVHLEEQPSFELMDEVQDQIVAGHLDAEAAGPDGPGYLEFLDALGFSSDPEEYPIVDFADDGIGGGSAPTGPTNTPTEDPTLDPRVVYRNSCHPDHPNDGRGPDGHGHLGASILGGLDVRSGSPYEDPDGFQRGLGVNPRARIGGTRVFGPDYDLELCGGTVPSLLLGIYEAGARISNTAWGCSACAGIYDADDQAFDVAVRDADPDTPGNQQLVAVVVAGNSGPGSATIVSPGGAKNVITVGTTESDRPDWTDGCGVGPTGADDATSIASFSSRGPAPGGRTKPEIVAPGTHIQGTASPDADYVGYSLCDPYQPDEQSVFAASSGTSFAAAAVSGGVSLLYWWIENGKVDGGSEPPSPAMVKAYLVAHARYLAGSGANDDLPSNSQGYGMLDLGAMFEAVPRLLRDQSHVFGDSAETWSWDGFVADPGRPVRVALAFTDAPGALGTSPQVNDLDLVVTVDGTSYRGNVFSGAFSTTGGAADATNNLEAVFLPAGAFGPVTIEVTATGIYSDGVPGNGDATDQDFALVCVNCQGETLPFLDGFESSDTSHWSQTSGSS